MKHSRAITGLVVFVAVAGAVILGMGRGQRNAEGFGSYLNGLSSTYPAAQNSRLDNCGLCHFDFGGGGSLNPYGAAFDAISNHSSNPAGAFAAIGPADSDGDGTSNGNEMTGLFMPGYDCTNYTQARNAPAGLADYVDPANPGCATATTPSPAPATSPAETGAPTPAPTGAGTLSPTPTATPGATAGCGDEDDEDDDDHGDRHDDDEDDDDGCQSPSPTLTEIPTPTATAGCDDDDGADDDSDDTDDEDSDDADDEDSDDADQDDDCGTAASETPAPTATPTPTPPAETPGPATDTPTPTPALAPTTGAPMTADVDCNGATANAVDALKVLRHVAGLSVAQTSGCAPIGQSVGGIAAVVTNIMGDMDCDGDVDSIDGLRILRHVAGLTNNLPPGCA